MNEIKCYLLAAESCRRPRVQTFCSNRMSGTADGAFIEGKDRLYALERKTEILRQPFRTFLEY